MWSSEPDRSRKRGRGRVWAAAAVAVGLALAGCGFQPLYGPADDGMASTAERMAATRIVPLPDRIGQQMHNLLRDRLNPRGQPAAPDYVLRVRLNESRRELGVRKDETATRANLIVSASFQLRDAATNEILLRGRARSINSYNILENQFATTFSERDARERALRELSNNIQTRLGIFFSGDSDQSS